MKQKETQEKFYLNHELFYYINLEILLFLLSLFGLRCDAAHAQEQKTIYDDYNIERDDMFQCM